MAASKRKDWSELLGSGSKTGTSETDASAGPAEPPVTVLMHTIVGNPDNPRPEEDYSDDDPEFRELKASMKEIGQLQPLAVVSRAVFEQAKPEAVAQASAKTRKLLQGAEWVVVTGNRRLAAARQLGWTRIDIRVQDQLGDEDGRIDEAVMIENIHRKNLAPIKEAEYLAGMVKRHGSQEKVAERIGKSQMFVSQRLALLNLAPDLREEVDAGTLKIKEARQVARTSDHTEQRARVAKVKAQAAQSRPATRREAASVQNPVLKPASEQGPAAEGALVQNPVLDSDLPPEEDGARDGAPAGLPGPRSDGPADAEVAHGDSGRPVRQLPYDDPVYVAMHLHAKMELPAFVEGARAWLGILRTEHPEEYAALVRELSELEPQSA
ncbi:putative plasmid partitioning protein B (plasmid) [Streptomyces davaonensis JCM 4913]|uniref:Putative plasmid partitioning protein B n=1 Tax=Streptomyces davaonensis (strain DSM 101723 / JCM 4913 / KCC S-0913 / 768) TaxID=1214101 RepID=K4RGL3_STRDJ|nr:ParB/RepB/Spo0J family partition protein [Streptomyces davaonensis]CCK32912.1 putative plasmid partitioning protein B [Streptomyces davaonensis JCM 4913]